jgi:hypothetical protein
MVYLRIVLRMETGEMWAYVAVSMKMAGCMVLHPRKQQSSEQNIFVVEMYFSGFKNSHFYKTLFSHVFEQLRGSFFK